MKLAPNLFLLGLPKCGTSTIFDQLSQHSSICGTIPKETFVLLDDNSGLQSLKKRDGWESFLSNEAHSVRYILEGSTHTIFQESALDYFKRNTDVKGIIVLRDPVKRIFSSFNFTKFNLNGIKNEVSFEDYVHDLLNEGEYQYIENEVSRFVLSNELKYSQYDRILQPWKSFIEAGRIKIIIFETFLDSPIDVYKEIFEWLAIDTEEIWETKGKNATLQPKNRKLHQLAVALNKRVYNWKTFQPIKRFYKSIMTKRKEVSKQDLKAMTMLKNALSGSIHRLEKQFGIQTSFWK